MAAPIDWKPNELDWVKKNCKLPRKEAHAKFVAKFNRQEIKLSAYNSLCKRNNWLTGRTGCYSKGSVPANKGKKMPYNPNSARTQFKKGNTPSNTKQLGHEYVTKDGYIMLSVEETNPHTGYKYRFVLKHKHLWEKKNGKIPEGHCLKCLDGNKQNTNPDNWECINRSVLLTLNKDSIIDYNTAPEEIKKPLLTVAKLKHASRQSRKRKNEQ